MKHVSVLFELFIGVYENGDALLHAGKLAATAGNEHKPATEWRMYFHSGDMSGVPETHWLCAIIIDAYYTFI